jgi:hypothetical protein
VVLDKPKHKESVASGRFGAVEERKLEMTVGADYLQYKA